MVGDIVQLMQFSSSAFFNAFDIGSDVALSVEILNETDYRAPHPWYPWYPYASMWFYLTCAAIALGGLLQTIGILFLWLKRNRHFIALPKPLQWTMILLSPTLLTPVFLNLYIAQLKIGDVWKQIRAKLDCTNDCENGSL